MSASLFVPLLSDLRDRTGLKACPYLTYRLLFQKINDELVEFFCRLQVYLMADAFQYVELNIWDGGQYFIYPLT
jgi:hypothetical protein